MQRFTANIEPIGKPRMTQRDKWKQRDCVVRYRAFADELRLLAPKDLPARPARLFIKAYLSMPGSWSEKKRAASDGQPHQVKPDFDNISKAVSDVLFLNDATIYDARITKYWCRANAQRLEIEVE